MSSLYLSSSASVYTNAITKTIRHPRFICKSTIKPTPGDAPVDLRRRSGNYQPSLWDHRSLVSIENKYAKSEKVIVRDILKKKVRKMLDVERKSRLEQLQLIDDLQKLGISYHFDLEINNILLEIYGTSGKKFWECNKEEDLHAMALEFRLLRQAGFDVSEDIFDVIVDKIEGGSFKSDDIKGIIALYEASYLSTKSDVKLNKIIKPFAIDQVRKLVDNENYDIELREMAKHALEIPYHWRMRRLEMRWYIDAYEKKQDTNRALIEFAKHDFNSVQIAHQEDLKHVSSWWEKTGLGKQLPFARDRILENYFWTVGMVYEPHFGHVRRAMTILTALITTIDDIYDVYGTIEELELFTALVDRWDVNGLDELPEYMRLCFLVLNNEINGIACDILKYKNVNVIPFLRKSWADLCKAYLVEAKWYKNGYKPSVEEYVQNAWVTISGPTMLIHFYCVFSEQISIQMLEALSQHKHHLVRCASIAFRLSNDLGTSSNELARGDVLKSVQCYMHETGVSEEKARAQVQQMISEMWDEMNHEIIMKRPSTLFSRGLSEAAMNLTRMSQCMYQYGDGHGSPDEAKTVDRAESLFFNPIPLD